MLENESPLIVFGVHRIGRDIVGDIALLRRKIVMAIIVTERGGVNGLVEGRSVVFPGRKAYEAGLSFPRSVTGRLTLGLDFQDRSVNVYLVCGGPYHVEKVSVRYKRSLDGLGTDLKDHGSGILDLRDGFFVLDRSFLAAGHSQGHKGDCKEFRCLHRRLLFKIVIIITTTGGDVFGQFPAENVPFQDDRPILDKRLFVVSSRYHSQGQ